MFLPSHIPNFGITNYSGLSPSITLKTASVLLAARHGMKKRFMPTFLSGIAQLVTVMVADKLHQHQYIRSLKPLIA